MKLEWFRFQRRAFKPFRTTNEEKREPDDCPKEKRPKQRLWCSSPPGSWAATSVP